MTNTPPQFEREDTEHSNCYEMMVSRDGNGAGNIGDHIYHPHPRFSLPSPSPPPSPLGNHFSFPSPSPLGIGDPHGDSGIFGLNIKITKVIKIYKELTYKMSQNLTSYIVGLIKTPFNFKALYILKYHI